MKIGRSFLLATTAGFVLSAFSVTASLAEDGVPEDVLNRQGLESSEKAKEGFTALSQAAFVLLFDETRPTTFGFSLGNPRAVTVYDANSKATLEWAMARSFAYAARQEREWLKRMNAASKDAEQNSAPPAATPKVTLQTAQADEAFGDAFQAWVAERSAQIRRVKNIYDPALLSRSAGGGQASAEEDSGGSFLGRVIGDAVEAVEEATDTTIIIGGDSRDTGGADEQRAVIDFSSRARLWNPRWNSRPFTWDGSAYDSVLDSTVSWSELAGRSGVYFRPAHEMLLGSLFNGPTETDSTENGGEGGNEFDRVVQELIRSLTDEETSDEVTEEFLKEAESYQVGSPEWLIAEWIKLFSGNREVDPEFLSQYYGNLFGDDPEDSFELSDFDDRL